MTPVQRLAIAEAHYRAHADTCPRCETAPDPCRGTGGCHTGRLLSLAFGVSWRLRINAMSGRNA